MRIQPARLYAIRGAGSNSDLGAALRHSWGQAPVLLYAIRGGRLQF